MARTQKLKVFRTSIGFHDAYVAVSSQKAALELWGSKTDLFATGAAERVEDPDLMREALAHPGQVFRRLRGTMTEHLAALPKDRQHNPRRKPSEARSAEPPAPRAIGKPASTPKPKPRPDRAALARAEARLAEATARHESERAEMARRQADLDRERRALEDDQAHERRSLEQELGVANARYDRAMRDWQAD